MFEFALSKKIDTKNSLIASCVTSYALLSVVSLIRIKWLGWIPDTAIVNSGLSIITGLLLVCIVAILSQRRWFRKITVKLFHKTLNSDIWRDVLDLEKGSNLKVYLKDKDYYVIGHHKNHEEKGSESWIALSAFAKFDKETNQNYKSEPSYLDRKDVIITLRFADIEHIEIF
ncbi:MAG: hypothetical protein NC321_10530 [Clostridium sp.]|nr:hypothetical protein [Clostridium sp.]